MSKSSSKDPPAAGAMETLSLDKDQMLQEKDKQIEELTRMLRQKQRLVETLRSQLEQGKMVAGAVVVKKEGSEKSRTPAEAKLQTLIKASSAQLPVLPNGAALTVKEEAEPEKGMEGVTEEAQAKRLAQPMQCSQETLLRLQQIHRLQLQQAELQQQQAKLQKDSEGKANPHKQQQQKKKEAQLLLHQQQLQQLIIQQTQQKQLQAQQKLAQQNQVKQTQGDVPAQQKNPVHKSQVQLKQVQVQIQNQKAAVSQRKQQRLQQRLQHKQQLAAASAQQVRQVFFE